MIDYTEFRSNLFLAAQKALLGEVTPNIRAVAVGFIGKRQLQIIYYLENEPTDDDWESINLVTSEILSDFIFEEEESKCIHTTKPLNELDSLSGFVYMRKEM